ncbi:MAG: KilA-N domain-containing protein [Betaproteobacteria bacterium]|nr:KilA-N domain-containing protein [Betaproteobacteria bacterium]
MERRQRIKERCDAGRAAARASLAATGKTHKGKTHKGKASLGRPFANEAAAVTAWRKDNNASISKTAAHFGMSVSTVKRYCAAKTSPSQNTHLPQQKETNVNALTVVGTAIRQDTEGWFCLNDLHRASGGEARHKPGNWLMLDQTKALISEVEIAGIPAIQSKQGLGTFVVKELVYAYAMWISPAFNLKVIRAYDALVTQTAQPTHLIPQTYHEALRLAADKEEQRAIAVAERDEAVRTKAHIGNKREATSMATAAKAELEKKQLQDKLTEAQLEVIYARDDNRKLLKEKAALESQLNADEDVVSDTVTVTDAAKYFRCNTGKIHRHFSDKGLVYKCEGNWVATSNGKKSGLVVASERKYHSKNGSASFKPNYRITLAGATELEKELTCKKAA